MSAGDENATSLVQQSANEAVTKALEEAHTAFIAELGMVTLEGLSSEFQHRLAMLKIVHSA